MDLISSKVSACLEKFETLVASEHLEEYRVSRSAWQDELDRLRDWCSETEAQEIGQDSLDFVLRDSGDYASFALRSLESLQSWLEKAISDPEGLKYGRNEDLDTLLRDLPAWADALRRYFLAWAGWADDGKEERNAEYEAILNQLDQDEDSKARAAQHHATWYLREESLPPVNQATPMQNYYRKTIRLIRMLCFTIDSFQYMNPPDRDYLVCFSSRNKYVLRFKDVDEKHVAAKFPSARSLIPRLALHISRCRAILKYRERRYNDPKGPNQRKFDVQESDYPDDEPVTVKETDIPQSSSSHAEAPYNKDLVYGKEPLSCPPIPESASLGEFQCPYCFYSISAGYGKLPNVWRKHLCEDLRAYVCVVPDCPIGDTWSFDHLFTWHSHMTSEHSIHRTPDPTVPCPICQHPFRPTELLEHIAYDLEELALFAFVDPFSQPSGEAGETSAVEATSSSPEDPETPSFWSEQAGFIPHRDFRSSSSEMDVNLSVESGEIRRRRRVKGKRKRRGPRHSKSRRHEPQW